MFFKAKFRTLTNKCNRSHDKIRGSTFHKLQFLREYCLWHIGSNTNNTGFEKKLKLC